VTIPDNAVIRDTLALFPDHLHTLTEGIGIKIRLLKSGERYDHASATLSRIAIDVDGWPVPPSGLFIVEERTILLRRATPMTVAHEYGHAIDCALGGGLYRTAIDPEIQKAFRNATQWVTPYAATRIDEYFAESVRAYVGVNDADSPWPKATRERLLKVDPAMYEIIASIFTP
jgi:hypothetical protein